MKPIFVIILTLLALNSSLIAKEAFFLKFSGNQIAHTMKVDGQDIVTKTRYEKVEPPKGLKAVYYVSDTGDGTSYDIEITLSGHRQQNSFLLICIGDKNSVQTPRWISPHDKSLKSSFIISAPSKKSAISYAKQLAELMGFPINQIRER